MEASSHNFHKKYMHKASMGAACISYRRFQSECRNRSGYGQTYRCGGGLQLCPESFCRWRD
eukprot:SAG11_NODE_3011_length_2766_cov_2.386577_3_plen_61_part_00